MQKVTKVAMDLVVSISTTRIVVVKILDDIGTVVCVGLRYSIGGSLCHVYKGF